MNYASINNIKVEDHTFESLLGHFSQEAFYRFMDHGRSGFRLLANDILDNFITHIKANHKDRTTKVIRDEYMLIYNNLVQDLVTNFMRDGTKGISGAIYHAHTALFAAMAKNNKK